MTNQMVNIMVMSLQPCFYLIPIRGEFITRTVSDNSCWRPLMGQNDNYIANSIKKPLHI